MKAIRKWQGISTALFAACILVTVLFSVTQTLGIAIAFTIADVVTFVFLHKQNRLLQDAILICSNRILCVSSAIILTENCEDKKILNETVVSTFGLLLGSKVYKWGCDGVRGVRLKQVRLDKERIWLTFGTDDEMRCIELLHGITNKQRIMEITQELLYETGVTAIINSW